MGVKAAYKSQNASEKCAQAHFDTVKGQSADFSRGQKQEIVDGEI